MNKAAGMYAFRELKTNAELLHAFRLRYKMYQIVEHLKALLPDNSAQIDIDGFDVFSRHYGLFHQSESGGKLIGYLRVVEQQKKSWVARVLCQLSSKYGMKPFFRPDSFFYKKDFQNVNQLLGLPLIEGSNAVCEVGRFIILPEFRAVGLAQFVIDSIMTIGFANPFLQFAIIDCQDAHRRLYERNGFCWVGGQAGKSNPWQLMVLSRASAEKKQPDLQARAQRYRDEGALFYPLGQADW